MPKCLVATTAPETWRTDEATSAAPARNALPVRKSRHGCRPGRCEETPARFLRSPALRPCWGQHIPDAEPASDAVAAWQAEGQATTCPPAQPVRRRRCRAAQRRRPYFACLQRLAEMRWPPRAQRLRVLLLWEALPATKPRGPCEKPRVIPV